MKIRTRLSLVIFAATNILPTVSVAEQSTCAVAGKYRVIGTNANGSPYEGEAVISADANGCRMKWFPPNASEGNGSYREGVLTINFTFPAGSTGVVKYVRAPNGQLTGPWWMNETPTQVGTETLIPRN